MRTADPICTTDLRSKGLVCHSRSDLGKVDRHHCHARTPHLALPLVSLPTFFALDVLKLWRFQMNANSTIFAPVCCPENFDEKPLWPSRSAREAFCPISHKVEVPFVHKLDHQVLSGEADSDEVRLLTVGGETEEDLFLPTFVKFGEFWLKGARGPQRKCWWSQTRPGPSPRFSYRCGCCEEGRVPTVQRQCGMGAHASDARG